MVALPKICFRFDPSISQNLFF